MNSPFLLFDVGCQRLALPVATVERVVAASEMIPLDEPHPLVRGLVNVGGEPFPVVDLRSSPGGLFPEIELSDRFILLRDGERPLALLVSSLTGVVDLDVDVVTLPGGESPRQVRVVLEEGETSFVLVPSLEVLLKYVVSVAEVP